ncbi:hypothetical protein TWF102_011592 [Orbilia oligospora]|uniref:Uncharacterized protein n=1 Tax=Orbilia oligospora TaxID=2813651 RepID=A0A7C8NJ57_ORBOL|nr:hypothetical protein TWF102_011592 [Orbilia oligospora]KAF3094629.1 hypothetical protein TWF706_008466 [Orbilia oligospora]KAF3096470.1 hypothetical protein TWF103_009804 [Orbilia oligospora]
MFLPPNNQIESNQLTSTGPVFNQNEAQVPNGDELILLLLLFFSVTRTCMEVGDVSREPVYVCMMWWVWWLVRREEQKNETFVRMGNRISRGLSLQLFCPRLTPSPRLAGPLPDRPAAQHLVFCPVFVPPISVDLTGTG